MDCPYCADRLIRHIQHQKMYWFCRTCWQPILLLKVESDVSPLPHSTDAVYPGHCDVHSSHHLVPQ